MARHSGKHSPGTHSTHINSLILFLLFCWSEGKSASGPQIPGLPLPAAGPWLCWTPRAAASLPSLVLRPPLTTTHRLGQTECLPVVGLLLGSPVSKPQACVCLVAGPQISYPSCCWSVLKFTFELCILILTYTEDWSSPGKHTSPLAGV